MKKLLLFFLLFSKSVLFSQTVLNSFPLNLNRPQENGQILSTEDVKTNEIYVFAADNKKTQILKYSKFFFFTDQFTDTINNLQSKVLIGHSFSEDGNPTLYWTSDNSSDIRIVKYFFTTKTTRSLNFKFPDYTGNIIATFQKNNTFYVLAHEKREEHLLLFEFNDGSCLIKMFDFSDFSFQNENGRKFTFTSLLQYYPLEKIESSEFNPLENTSRRNKMYFLDNRILLTLNYNVAKTETFELNLESLDVKRKVFDQPVSQKPLATSNSFYIDKKLFQFSVNNEEFLFNVKDFESGGTIKNVSISKNDTITFKNSPLFLQTNGQTPKRIKTTAKFLKQLSSLKAGISVIKNRENTFITFGGFEKFLVSTAPSYDYRNNFFSDFDDGSYSEYVTKMAFFDAIMDSNLEFVHNKQPEILAIDNISYYRYKTRNIAFDSIIKLKDFYILGYYDLASRKYIMRKFTDGFMNEDLGNPIMNKALLSNPATFGDLKPNKN
ncbi:hypothetical protein BD847_1538 [Flavobacterium cutihirudinis]|uniref:6-bladed beta-propeller protein n=1 Tax=Flavobacterium cutihirudinis TaxID=1265740 RepID=A0A3D9FXG1_9FLAO|nr:hypothetical protein [Flavobacterium cutihirudinis]RED24802.1 hypothetical protein BD847_1538 [Flavobacterium cutihirudinis]